MAAAEVAAGEEQPPGVKGDNGCTLVQVLCNETVNASAMSYCRVISGLGSWTLGFSAADKFLDQLGEKSFCIQSQGSGAGGN